MVAVFIAILLFLSPVMPGFTAVPSAPTHAPTSAVEIAHEDCDDSKSHTAPGQCCAVQCLVFVAEGVPTEVRHVPSFVDVAYVEPVDHLMGIIFPPSLGPPRTAA
ncbi:hypothetical protein J2W42_002336 [Rhizobium tibeticum]|uniref:DUF2946 domain-containing protein n=1 Tax=Rhizobium tibeticum TaxID=501024 RepID=A0A1H8RJT2_9HYPH|nr:hypothetical protein [Rhizobium tibeticum]MDP9809484.1 hypothetical protein [Rhizobium tibeticum]SEI06686.1 hypothetical protein RTCCBAU85039_4150 [Rhizobium tibeticum]SEO66454.1 hypothetical protein SAMN05216228_1021135 [Rhizobium tibeticum]